jgi:hypothetical protein
LHINARTPNITQLVYDNATNQARDTTEALRNNAGINIATAGAKEATDVSQKALQHSSLIIDEINQVLFSDPWNPWDLPSSPSTFSQGILTHLHKIAHDIKINTQQTELNVKAAPDLIEHTYYNIDTGVNLFNAFPEREQSTQKKLNCRRKNLNRRRKKLQSRIRRRRRMRMLRLSIGRRSVRHL